MNSTTSKWVFNKKLDFIAFSGPILLSLFLYLLILSSSLFSSHLLLLLVLINISLNFVHLHSTFWVAYTSPESWKRMGAWFLFIPIFFFVFLNITREIYGGAFNIGVVSMFSIMHFLKQQTAWFYIAKGRSAIKQSQWLNRIDKISILSVTWGFVLTSQSAIKPRGWFVPGDLPVIPNQYHTILLYASLLGASLYIFKTIYLYISKKAISWSATHIFLCALLIWGHNRLLPISSLGFLLNQTHHTIPYLMLAGIYLKNELHSGKRFWLPKISFWKLIMLLYVLSWFLSSFEVGFITPQLALWDIQQDLFGRLSPYFLAALATLSLSHFILDGIFWNSKHNPGWSKALDSV